MAIESFLFFLPILSLLFRLFFLLLLLLMLFLLLSHNLGITKYHHLYLSLFLKKSDLWPLLLSVPFSAFLFLALSLSIYLWLPRVIKKKINIKSVRLISNGESCKHHKLGRVDLPPRQHRNRAYL